MKRRKKLKSKRHNIRNLKRNQHTVLLIVFFVTGLLLGALSLKVMNEDFSGFIKELAETFIKERSSQSALQNLLSSIVSDTVYLLIIAVFGLCLAGEPVLWLIPLVRGLGTGLVSGYYYRNFGLEGMLYCASIIFIPTILSVSATILACKESIITSKSLLKSVKSGKPQNSTDFFKMYFARNVIVYAVMIISALVGALLTYLFADKIILLS